MNKVENRLPETTPVVAAPDRRRFLAMLSLTLGTLGAAIVGIPVAGFFAGSLFRKKEPVWRVVGLVEQFKIGETVAVHFENGHPLPWDGVTATTAAWLRREADQQFVAFSVNCTHLGCPVQWKPESNLFMCPCHGGVYYENGDVAGGPPPRPLPRYPVRVNRGQVEIQAGAMPIV